MTQEHDQRLLALRTGVTAASSSVAATFARGLLPRSTSDQAIATGATAAYWLGSATLGLSAVQSLAELMVKARGKGTPENATLLASVGVLVAGSVVVVTIPDVHETPLPLAGIRSGAWILSGGALATTLVIGSDKLFKATIGPQPPVVSVGVAAAVGAATSALRVWSRDRRAITFGETGDRRQIVAAKNTTKLAQSVGLGAGVGGGLIGLAALEWAVAEGTTRVVSAVMRRRSDPVTPLIGHAVAGAGLTYAGLRGLNRVRRRVMHADDIREPAYPEPPTSPHVSAGPDSIVGFDAIGKEGRRFVLMTLTPEAITAVMGEPAIAPVRAVAGYETARTHVERAKIALEELERLGAYERSVIVVAAPTGVGYVNYSFAETLEYLTRGDCAIIVPQYALIPSALALDQTSAGVRLQTLILKGIRDRVAAMPPQSRPKVYQFGESLGAQVALDVAAYGTAAFTNLGLSGGLYLGTPFRTKLWDTWSHDPDSVDPGGLVGAVSQADEIANLSPTVTHVQIIHNDDPINKFDYTSVVRAPAWMGPPETRPPGVPRETDFRPVITFIISLVDLKNGMNSKPGEFVRLGHDYRIELREAVQRTYGLSATAEQEARIETALREREREWAARRMVARRFAKARSSVLSQLHKWGVDPDTMGLDATAAADLAKGDISGLISKLGSGGTS